MPKYSPNINFMMQISRKISAKLIRDHMELENLQSSIQSAEKFAQSSLFRIKKMVIDEITDFKPEDNILIDGEKEYLTSNDTSKRWIIKPISGFKNFTRSLLNFCFIIALETRNKEGVFEAVSTLVEIPLINEVFYAEKNNGAFTSNRRLRVSSVKDIENSLISTDVYQNKFKHGNIRWGGCLPIEICNVVSGKCDACLIKDSNEIERRCMFLLLKESGGRITGLSGNDCNMKEAGFIASNGNIHKELINRL